jgi:hypothetical protein
MTALITALVALVFVSAGGGQARASCNTIPTERRMFVGVLGSIDRPFVSPDLDETVKLRPGPESTAAALQASASTALLITIVFKPPAAAPREYFIAGNGDCDSLEEPVCFLERLFCHVPRRCFTGSEVDLRVSMENEISFRFPDTGSAGPVTIAVGPPDRPPLGLEKLTCEQFLQTKAGANLALCIDRFRLPMGDLPLPAKDPPPTALTALPASYDYTTICTHSVGGPPNCSGTGKEVAYSVNSDGDVVMPINWRNILRLKGSGPELQQRELQASTVVEAVLGQRERILIPSAAFLETTTQQGGGFSPNPVFIPADPPDRPNEQTFFGTADQGKSVLKFLRRRLWDRTCQPPATQPLDSQPQACEADADCGSGTCVPSAPAYFACDAGARFRLPCTQPAQCPQGACRRVSDTGSVCVLVDGTWTQTACKQDSDCGAMCQLGSAGGDCVAPDGTSTGPACKQDGDCGKCGPGLFEFRNRTVKGVGKLTRVATGVPGVCESGSSEGNPCTASSACNTSLFGGVQCVTYRAEALSFSATP